MCAIILTFLAALYNEYLTPFLPTSPPDPLQQKVGKISQFLYSDIQTWYVGSQTLAKYR